MKHRVDGFIIIRDRKLKLIADCWRWWITRGRNCAWRISFCRMDSKLPAFCSGGGWIGGWICVYGANFALSSWRNDDHVLISDPRSFLLYSSMIRLLFHQVSNRPRLSRLQKEGSNRKQKRKISASDQFQPAAQVALRVWKLLKSVD